MKQLNHFSHRHPLRLSGVQPEDQTICSGCDLDLVGPAYICTKAGCSFLLHESCFELPRRVRHKSHPKHPLVLLSSPPYSDGEFTCNACGESGHAFTFHCLTCKFDLHVECASLPETEDSDDHEHPVKLLYSFPEEEWKGGFVCDVCHCPLVKSCWFYSCSACNFCTHLECVTDQEFHV